MRGKYENEYQKVGAGDGDEQMWSIWTEPKFGIGQRCVFIQTDHGNVLWDCITNLDEETAAIIKQEGGLKAIIISHPHYYTTHLEWAQVFDCPVYLASDDKEWISREDQRGCLRFIEGTSQQIIPGVTAIKVGGHFPGSLVLLWNKKLLIADSFVTTPSALYHVDRLPGTTSYAFMWAIPNMIPLPPAELYKMWQAIRPYEFHSTHGAFVGQDVRDEKVKDRVLESMKIQTRAMGWEKHALLEERLL
ncbi:hypothetical protein LTR35_005121 [Friedmanniomyces endolithicus]|uniref:Metallo-beta-lactamase domain-containing protein n=1 Tax=Friedmanniomyces endolithicus TaxID=329885 RepID=A0AAN6J6J8_9PEZI|nr:hypothetical protein LTR35_005121 [Friedmanniomyces endolithicus]KAK0298745.1 hypothetical protein LTS00_002507 [Friedmanniomyces endolithicus]KAK0319123.1 hypothetical protein LTR82_009887 [Friedmanniomyces endolithicus]KAK0985380.1 hypothetical protein LTR54_013775 [Friedmanniomyces endolithicus]